MHTFTFESLSEEPIKQRPTVAAECWPLIVVYFEAVRYVDAETPRSVVILQMRVRGIQWLHILTKMSHTAGWYTGNTVNPIQREGHRPLYKEHFSRSQIIGFL